MQRDADALAWDALRAAELISEFTHGKSFDRYERDPLLRSAVERQFQVIGDALNRLVQADPELASSIPDLPRIVAFRNILVHGYASVDDRLVWQVVQDRLPSLAAALRDVASFGGDAHERGAGD
jgi:uncharacterized protein with HEPN domain